MPYTVKSSEAKVQSGTDAETKALLYMMGERADSDEIDLFVVDFFNDLTGATRYFEKLWDVQSKANLRCSKEVGRALVTLLKNYNSEFKFDFYILCTGSVPKSLLKNPEKKTFGIEDIAKAKSVASIKEGLRQECDKKGYTKEQNITDEIIEEFLKKVSFIIVDKPAHEYVKSVIKNYPKVIPQDEDILRSIFHEICKEQAAKKHSEVENIQIQDPDQALYYHRHLTVNEIKLLILQRIIGADPLQSGRPRSFDKIYAKSSSNEKFDALEGCQRDVCRVLFDRANSSAFWRLFENIHELIVANPNWDVEDVFRNLDREVRDAVPHFISYSLKYFIALVKDSIDK